MISNLFTAPVRTGATTLVLCALLVPAVSQAALGDRAVRTGSSTGTRVAFSCDTIDTMQTKFLTQLDARAVAIAGRPQLGDKVETGKAARLAQLETTRETNDERREAAYDALRGKASTTAQKAAVTTFVAEVEALVVERKAAVDAAIAAFEAGVDDMKADLDGAVSTAKSTAKSEITALFAEAKAACTETSTAAEIQTLIRTGLTELKADRSSMGRDGSFRTALEALRATRKTAIEAAHAEFRTGMDAAKAELKASLAADA